MKSIKLQSKVIFINRRIGYFGELRCGIVTFYNPATESSCVVTAGCPFYGIAGNHSNYLVSASDTMIDTKKNRQALAIKLATEYMQEVQRLKTKADNIMALAYTIQKNPTFES